MHSDSSIDMAMSSGSAANLVEPPADDFLIELIICTRNGGDRLAKCLQSVSACRGEHPFLVNIIDNGSNDNVSLQIARDFVERFGQRARFSIESVPGNSAGRNKALRELKGTYAVFIDDDCYVDPEFINAWERVLRTTDFGFGGGTILPYDKSQSLLGCWSAPNSIVLAKNTFVKRGFIQGSNMFFSAACLRDIGLFDAHFGAGTDYAGEEWDMAIAASRRGWKSGYFVEPTVYHDHGRSQTEAEMRMGFYDYGAGAVYAKHALRRDTRAVKSLIRELAALPFRRKISIVSGFVAYISRSHLR